ncbi:MAG TPA: YqgE/AlgH family protein [Flavobacteriaceae bacterium]|nr:YqgE/AlgH family protein [Flavobacteriaceae bacterium]
MIDSKPNKGLLLIAEPSLTGDISFARSVVLLADHNENGSVGFIMNKLLDFTLNDLLPEIHQKFKVYNGGPVEQDNLFFIHKIPHFIPGSIEIANGIYWGGDFKIIKNLIQEQKISENEIKFFLGYSGWDGDQLQEEMAANAWIIVQNEDKNELVGRSFSGFWKDKIKELGGEYLIWANAPDHPSYN